jgi:uncharacterized protein YecE (DUF72 family)
LGETLAGTEYVTAPIAYLRLHGRSKNWFTAKNRDQRYDYLYATGSLEKIKTKVQSMAARAEKTFVAANNHPKGQAAANAIELKSLLSGKKVMAPEPLVKTYPAGRVRECIRTQTGNSVAFDGSLHRSLAWQTRRLC